MLRGVLEVLQSRPPSAQNVNDAEKRLRNMLEQGACMTIDPSIRSISVRRKHPVIYTHLPESRYPTLYGIFSPRSRGRTAEPIIWRGAGFAPLHCLLIDRRDRKAYICQRGQTTILFALMELEGADHLSSIAKGTCFGRIWPRLAKASQSDSKTS
jgi:hypothetical protein